MYIADSLIVGTLMHFVLGFLGLLAAGAFWWYRMRDVGRAAGEVIDTAQTIKGAYNRRKFRNKAEGSAITAINDAPTAATTILMALALSRGRLSREAEDFIRNAAADTMQLPNTDEVLTFSRWAAEQSPDPNNVIVKLSPILLKELSLDQRRQFLDMANGVCVLEGEPDAMQKDALRRLRDRMPLQ